MFPTIDPQNCIPTISLFTARSLDGLCHGIPFFYRDDFTLCPMLFFSRPSQKRHMFGLPSGNQTWLAGKSPMNGGISFWKITYFYGFYRKITYIFLLSIFQHAMYDETGGYRPNRVPFLRLTEEFRSPRHFSFCTASWINSSPEIASLESCGM